MKNTEQSQQKSQVTIEKIRRWTFYIATGGGALLFLLPRIFPQAVLFHDKNISDTFGLLSILAGAMLLSFGYLQSGGLIAHVNDLKVQLLKSQIEAKSAAQEILVLEKLISDWKITTENGVNQSAHSQTAASSDGDKVKEIIRVKVANRVNRLTKGGLSKGSSLGEVRLRTSDLRFGNSMPYGQRVEKGVLAIPSVDRMKREIADLRLRSNINLILGMAITAIGIYLLWSTVTVVDSSDLLKKLADQDEVSYARFFKNLALPLAPKFMLVIFIEVFAYFFLRLYKTGLEDIKYFQNELTNLESKFIALEVAIMEKNPTALKSAVEVLSKTERNFILSKGQSTVELERAKNESDFAKEVLKYFPKIFSDKSQKPEH